MKREHITLPTLQFAAAAFMVTSVQAKLRCIDRNSKIVAPSNCDGSQAPDNFFLVSDSAPNNRIDSSDPAAREAAGFSENGLVAEGFGKRFICDSTNDNPDDDCPIPDIDLGNGKGRLGG